MSQDPYPSGRETPESGTPYSDDPYVPSDRPQPPPYGGQPPMPPYSGGQPMGPGAPLPPGAPGAPVPPPYAYPRPAQQPNSSAIVLTVISGVATLTGLCCYLSIVPLVFGILGIVQQDSDPDRAAQMTKYGWISFAVIAVLAVIGLAAFIALIIASES
ncbi:MAG: hypothetical protein ACTMHL_01230 [Janibacter sp.]